MSEIVLNETQASIFNSADMPVVLRDQQGNCLGYAAVASKLSPEEIAELKRRVTAGGRRLTTEEVIQRLQSLTADSNGQSRITPLGIGPRCAWHAI